MKKFFKIRESFAARTSMYIIIVVGIVFIATLSVSFYFSYKTVESSAMKNAEVTMAKTTLEMERLLSGISKMVDNIKLVVEDGNLPADTVYLLVRQIVANNTDIAGCAVAFEPYYFKDKGYYFSPFAYRQGDSVVVKQLGNPDYDYFTMEWYQIPKLLDKNFWTEPYYDEGGGESIVSTYSTILRNKNGEFIGVLTADISLDWLSTTVQNLKPYPNSYSFAIGCGGTFIVHPDKDKILNESIFSIALEDEDPTVMQSLGQKMVDGESGEAKIVRDDKLCYFFYAPIEQIGWSLAMVCPKDDIFADLSKMSQVVFNVALFGLLLILVFCRLTMQKVASPLKSFAASAKKVAHGDFNVALPEISSKDEMKELRDSFGYMQKELVHHMASLESTASAKEKIESELRIAHNIQQGMIPKTFPAFPTRTDLDIYASLDPAKEVGGDLYDFYIEGDLLYFIIGDVSGKGVPASLLMAVTRSLFRSNSAYLKKPADIVSSISNAITEGNDSNMFVTLFLGILNLKTGELRYCNAGHNHPVLLSDDTVSFFPMKPNIPIGLFHDFPYEDEVTQLANGAVLFCYTDGLTEAESETKELYGDDRLLAIMQGKQRYSSKRQVQVVLADVAKHVGKADQSDDLTILTITSKFSNYSEVLTLKNEMSEVETLKLAMDSFFEKVNVPPEMAMPLQLSMEEVIVNVIMYAYAGKPGTFEVELSECASVLTFVITDSGIPFNPAEKEDPDITLAAEDRQIGGLGVFLVKQLMDDVEYNRRNNQNILTLRKAINKK